MNSQAPATAKNVVLAPDSFPRWILFFAGGIIAFSLISVGLVRLTGNGPDQRAAAVVSERLLRFEDRPDHGISVLDGSTAELVAVVQGEQGFIRGSLRALTRERHARDIGPTQPFRLTAHVDGRLTLTDPSTGEHIDLASFGPTNAGAFARFLLPAAKP